MSIDVTRRGPDTRPTQVQVEDWLYGQIYYGGGGASKAGSRLLANRIVQSLVNQGLLVLNPLTTDEWNTLVDAAQSWADELDQYIAPASESSDYEDEQETGANQRQNAQAIRAVVAKLAWS